MDIKDFIAFNNILALRHDPCELFRCLAKLAGYPEIKMDAAGFGPGLLDIFVKKVVRL